MSVELNMVTSQKHTLADLLRNVAKLIQNSNNKRVNIQLQVDFNPEEMK